MNEIIMLILSFTIIVASGFIIGNRREVPRYVTMTASVVLACGLLLAAEAAVNIRSASRIADKMHADIENDEDDTDTDSVAPVNSDDAGTYYLYSDDDLAGIFTIDRAEHDRGGSLYYGRDGMEVIVTGKNITVLKADTMHFYTNAEFIKTKKA